jgi:pSer/pThr/pTyr-binding forkhead associated (FHA) protein
LIEGAFNHVFRARPPSTEEELSIEQHTKTKQVLGRTHDNELASRWLLDLADRQVRLGEPVVSLGRALDNDIVLPDPTVSRYHAQLRWREGCYHLFPPERSARNDMGSQAPGHARPTNRLSTQTMLNRRAVVQCPLQPGDVLTLGQTTIKIVLDGPEA